jgi:hypothetical protein
MAEKIVDALFAPDEFERLSTSELEEHPEMAPAKAAAAEGARLEMLVRTEYEESPGCVTVTGYRVEVWRA